MEVQVTATPELRLGAPRQLFSRDDLRAAYPEGPEYDVSDDGHFLFRVVRSESVEPAKAHIALDWFGELEEKMAAASENSRP